jgi:hypothetical protein
MCFHHRNRLKAWSRPVFVFLALQAVGCADGAKIAQEHDRGGVVVYPFKGEQGAILSSFRKDAFGLMREKCGGPYTIIREGETKGRARMASPIEGAQDIVLERRWGIQFECK